MEGMDAFRTQLRATFTFEGVALLLARTVAEAVPAVIVMNVVYAIAVAQSGGEDIAVAWAAYTSCCGLSAGSHGVSVRERTASRWWRCGDHGSCRFVRRLSVR